MSHKILVTQSSMPDLNEYVEEIRDIWDSHWLTNMGIKHQKLQEQLCSYLEVPNIELLTNGHMALELVIQAMNLKGEVITTPYTFASTTHAIVRNGLKPVFCDINPYDFTMDVSKIEELITDKTSAIIPVHVYGNVCNVEEISDIARKYGLKVIYDAAHTFGVKYKNKGIGNYGDASCFSFHATKVFNTIEGGAACFHNEAIGKKIYGLKNFGIRGPEEVDDIGTNAKMNEFCAAMGICNLRHIEDEIKKRKKVVECYLSNLAGVTGLQFNPKQTDVEPNYAYFPIIVDEEILDAVGIKCVMNLKKWIFVKKIFLSFNKCVWMLSGEFDINKTPIALRISKQVLTLPLYADLELQIVEKICEIIRKMKMG